MALPQGAAPPWHHVCLIHRGEPAHMESVAAFLQEGLRRGERCLFVAGDAGPGPVLHALRDLGVDPLRAAADGSLVVRSKRESYLRGTGFSGHEMIEFLAQSSLDAKEAGFRALRATGDMSWALEGGASPEELVEYEALVDDALPKLGIRGLCQYDARLFSREILDAVVPAHPLVDRGEGPAPNDAYAPRSTR